MSSQSRQSKRTRVLRRFTTANIVFLAALLLAELVIAERHWLTTFATYIPQHPFGVPTALLLLVSIRARDARAMVLNAVAALFFLLVFMGFNIPWRGIGHSDGVPIRVMTYNIHHSPHGVDRTTQVLVDSNADIICMQEANSLPKTMPDPVPGLVKRFPGWNYARGGDVATFSRYPIVERKFHLLSAKTGRGVLVTRIDVNGTEVTVLNTHLAVGADPRAVDRSRPVRDYVENSADIRLVQARELLDIADKIDTPVLIAGDFNIPPRGIVYRRIASCYSDTFRRVGWGLGYTYRSFPGLLRIDFMFTGAGVSASDCRVIETRASDHSPVVADFTIGN